jgi:transcription antitermination factor NusG
MATPVWYALQSKPHQEDALWRQLSAHAVENYYPRLPVRVVNPRARRIRPYFPGYMFVRCDLVEVGISFFNWMPYAVGLVSFGGEPAPVPAPLVTGIQQRVDHLLQSGQQWFDGLERGDSVRIRDGLFKDYQAVFDARLSGEYRVRVLLQLLGGQSVALDIDAAHLEPIRR